MDEKIKETIAENLRQARESTGLSHTAYAKALGTNRTTLYLYESGKRIIPTALLYKIYNAYGTTPNEILGIELVKS